VRTPGEDWAAEAPAAAEDPFSGDGGIRGEDEAPPALDEPAVRPDRLGEEGLLEPLAVEEPIEEAELEPDWPATTEPEPGVGEEPAIGPEPAIDDEGALEAEPGSLAEREGLPPADQDPWSEPEVLEGEAGDAERSAFDEPLVKPRPSGWDAGTEASRPPEEPGFEEVLPEEDPGPPPHSPLPEPVAADAPALGQEPPLTPPEPGTAMADETGIAEPFAEDEAEELPPVEERTLYEPAPDAEIASEGPAEPLPAAEEAPPPPPPAADAAPEPPPPALESPRQPADPPASEPPATRGFFDDTAEHEGVAPDERSRVDPDFEN
jgi:hypothetical protein